MRKAPIANIDASQGQNLLRQVLFPLTRNVGLANQSTFEGYRAPLAGPSTTKVGAYSSPFAPADLLSIGVLSDARNRVGF